MESIQSRLRFTALACRVLMMATLVSSGNAYTRYGRPLSDRAPSALRVRPPPMTADPISPDCYNFTIGNWRLQEFYSPNYPGEYLNNTDCVLYLEAPSGFRIQLDFRDEFTLEKSDGCKYDFLEVRDGPFAYSPVIGRFCGAIFPPLIESSNRFLWLRFKTDDLLQYGGFRAVYSYRKDHTQNDGTSLSKVAFTVCRIPLKLDPSHPDGILTSEEVPFGDVTDPEYPRDRPVDCTWEIFTDQGHAINLHTIRMSRGQNARCEASHVSLYQGTTLKNDRRARLCGNDAPDVMSLTSQHNRVFVRLYGNSLHTKPQLEMVYSLVKAGEHCARSGYFSCGGEYCIPASMRCNGRPNCPDKRDERGCPRIWGGGAGPGDGDGVDRGGRGRGQGGGDTRTPAVPAEGDQDPQDSEGKEKEEEETKIPLHMLILGAVGGILLTSILLGVCIMCRSRRRRQARYGKGGDGRAKEQGKQHHAKDMPAAAHVPVSHHQHHHRPGDGRPGGQGHPQGRYLTSAYVSPLPKDSPNRHSFTSSTLTPGSDGGEPHGDIMTDSGQFRRFLPLDVGSDHLEDGCLYTPQGVIIGMTHLPSAATTSPTTTTLPQEGGGGLSVKYQPGQWQKGVMEDPSVLYHPPYTSSLPRPSPFLEMSSPYTGDHGKYPKSLHTLKEDSLREKPAA